MQKRFFGTVAAVTAACVSLALPAAADEADSRTDAAPVKILSIGNSFSNDAQHYLAKICESAGKPVILGNATIGGCTLKRHWLNASTNGVSYSYKRQPKTLAQMLEAEEWQFVTIQQASWFSQNPDTYEPYGTKLIAFIKEHAPQAEIVLHETWAYRGDESRIRKAGLTPYEMFAKVDAAYKKFAKAHNLRIIPSGPAFKTAWDHRKDGYHANAFGQYLIGLVWANTLLDIAPQDVPYVPKEVGELYAGLLKEIAAKTVARP